MYNLLSDLTTEEQLLLSLCRVEPGAIQGIKGTLVKGSITGNGRPGDQRTGRGSINPELIRAVSDWDAFVRIANEHGVIALCWFNLTLSEFGKEVPPRILEKLHSAYLRSLTRNTFLNNLLTEVINHAKERKIKVVLLKGMALEGTVYGNRGLRQMNDIDILVRKDQALLLRSILLENGFESMPLISPLHNRIMPDLGKHLPELIKKKIAVEIHFRLFEQNGDFFTEEIFSRAIRFPGFETDVYYPDPQLFFLYLVKHLDSHERTGTSQLRLYTDLVSLLTLYRDDILNERLFDYSHKAGIFSALAGKLYILAKWWDIGLQSYMSLIRENINQKEVTERFISFLRNPNENGPGKAQESLLLPMKEFTSITDKLLFITGYVFPSLEFMKYRYKAASRASAILYYPVRWGKLIRLIFSNRL